jgi:hypothetical protein
LHPELLAELDEGIPILGIEEDAALLTLLSEFSLRLAWQDDFLTTFDSRAGLDVLDKLPHFTLEMIRASKPRWINEQDKNTVAFFRIGHCLGDVAAGESAGENFDH